MDKIEPVKSITPFEVYKVLSSEKLTDGQKAEFIKMNSAAVKNAADAEISASEFKEMMAHRPLVRFRPLKNSFTKQGDDIILAKALNIDIRSINIYINSLISSNFEAKDVDKDTIDKVKTYVYRHGTKDQVVAFLEYELSDVKFVLERLYRTFDSNSGGVFGYFLRPIHRMDNNTLSRIYNVVDKSLRNSLNAGYIDQTKFNSTAEWALVKIHEIQNNSKVLRAYDLYKDLT